MAARESAEAQKAVKLVTEKGMTPYAAAKALGLVPKTVYNALIRRGLHVAQPTPEKNPGNARVQRARARKKAAETGA